MNIYRSNEILGPNNYIIGRCIIDDSAFVYGLRADTQFVFTCVTAFSRLKSKACRAPSGRRRGTHLPFCGR